MSRRRGSSRGRGSSRVSPGSALHVRRERPVGGLMKWVAVRRRRVCRCSSQWSSLSDCTLLPRRTRRAARMRLTRPRADVWPVLTQPRQRLVRPGRRARARSAAPPGHARQRDGKESSAAPGRSRSHRRPAARRHDHRRRLGQRTRSSGSVSRFVIGHHATMDTLLKNVAKTSANRPPLGE